MKRRLNILLLEDQAVDAELIVRELHQAGVDFIHKRVETRQDFLREIGESSPDVILADYHLPQFDGLQALRLLRDSDHDIPFILVTGTQSEEVAVKCIKQGADDYILKNSLKRLPSAVSHALRRRESEREKEKAESELRRLATAIEQAAEAVYITDVQGAIQYANPAFQAITGYSPGEAVGKNPRILKSGKHGKAYYRELWETILGGKVWPGRMTNRRKDGSLYEEDGTISPIRDGAGRIVSFVAVRRDITKEIDLETQLQQIQKMECVGQLAGGVAHDFNNLLQVILANADIAVQEMPPGDPCADSLQEIAAAAQRAATLTRQLLAFSRRQALVKQELDLNDLAGNLMKMLRRIIAEHIELEFKPGLNRAIVNADPGLVEQSIINLCVNARDAMPNGGKIVISAGHADLDAAFCERHIDAVEGRYVFIEVADTGTGIAPDILPHIFEPFFTTKQPGKGTGLGLATVYGIAKQHGGLIDVKSEPGKGAAFILYLPATEKRAERPVALADEGAPGGSETILVAEDDDNVRAVTVKNLRSAGYRVLAARDGREAVLLFATQPDHIDLLLFDVIMPRMSGPEACERVRKMRPGIPVIFLSGYRPESFPSALLESGATVFLNKPLESQALLRSIRETLDTTRQPQDAGSR